MTEPTEHNTDLTTRRPFLVAAWPGMGNVAAIAAGYLVRKLDLEPVGVVPLIDTFDLNFVGVRGGVVERPHLPRGLVFRTPEDRPGRPLIVFLAEAQPTRQGYGLAHTLLDQLGEEPIERVFSFASLASGVHPSEEPAVTAAATSRFVLEELTEHGIEPARDGRIGGMNGLLLGVASERELHGACLLAEIPAFAAKAPNFRAARALLRAFCEATEIDVDFGELNDRVDATEPDMLRLMERFESGGREGGFGADADGDESFGDAFEPEVDDSDVGTGTRAASPPEPDIDEPTREAIEALFEHAADDRSEADRLKSELDRLGVFEEYEDRFLDLFRSQE